MRGYLFAILFFSVLNCFSQISVYPDNPKYFIFKERPTILIGSTEHYGAVINKDLNYQKYLITIKKTGLNLAREYAGDYIEAPGDFCIENNPLSPIMDSLFLQGKEVMNLVIH